MRITRIARDLFAGAHVSMVFEALPDDRHRARAQFTATSRGLALVVRGLRFTATLGSVASDEPVGSDPA